MGTNALLVSLCKFNLVAQRCIILVGQNKVPMLFRTWIDNYELLRPWWAQARKEWLESGNLILFDADWPQKLWRPIPLGDGCATLQHECKSLHKPNNRMQHIHWKSGWHVPPWFKEKLWPTPNYGPYNSGEGFSLFSFLKKQTCN